MASYHVYHGLNVETNLNGEVKDHRDGFQQEQYRRGMSKTFESVPDGPKDKGPGEMKTRPIQKPQPKRSKKTKTDDDALKRANQKDLSNRNIN
jgi:hypothetical protein